MIDTTGTDAGRPGRPHSRSRAPETGGTRWRVDSRTTRSTRPCTTVGLSAAPGLLRSARERRRRVFPKTGGVIVAVNHCANYDPVFMGLARPRRLGVPGEGRNFSGIRFWAAAPAPLGSIPLHRGAAIRAPCAPPRRRSNPESPCSCFPRAPASRTGQAAAGPARRRHARGPHRMPDPAGAPVRIVPPAPPLSRQARVRPFGEPFAVPGARLPAGCR
ncbi:MAG: hypothetical protein MZV49_00630 [Rhodopseudomonas palustris]|nr:hypothetical protein [Rhodopseudomonas palustris]